MSTCESCGSWKKPDRWDDGVGTCERITHSPIWDESDRRLAYTEDYEGYASWLRTRADFGCVLWGKKA